MRKIIVSEFLTLDGVSEDPGGAEKSRYGGWSFPFWNEEAEKYKHDELFTSDTLLLGRKTYEGFAEAWPSMTDKTGFAERMNTLPKYVVSTTLQETSWHNSSLIQADIADEITKLKMEPGQNILVGGSGELVNTLQQHGLVDEYHLMIHPVIVGGGKKLFRKGTECKLKLKTAKTFQTGVAVLVYETA